jgi:hypothetical protein
MADSTYTQAANFGVPKLEDLQYLKPKQIWHRYCSSYSTFMKQLKMVIRKGNYRKEAFRVIPQQDLKKRAYNQFEIHPVWGIEVLDEHFSARNARC